MSFPYFRVLLAFWLTLGVCSGVAATTTDKPQVLVSIKPLQLILQEIAGADVNVSLLLDPGVSPHSYHLRPSEVSRIMQADAFYWVGPGLETFLANVIVSVKPKQVVTLMALPSIRPLLRQQDPAIAGEDSHHQPALDTADAHIWLSPDIAQAIAAQAAEQFSRLNPQQTSAFQQRLQQFTAHLAATDQQIQDSFKPYLQTGFYSAHDAYGYFVYHYRLKQLGYLALTPDRQPGARHIAELRSSLEQSQAHCIVLEAQFRPGYVDTLTAGLNVHEMRLDPLGGDADSYPQLLQQLGAAMTACLAP